MSNFFNNVKTVNSAIRTAVAVVCLGGVGYGGWFGYSNYLKPGLEAKTAKADLDKLRVQFEEQQTAFTKLQGEYEDQSETLRLTELKNQKLQTSLKLLKFDRRIANVEVISKSKNEKGEPTMLVRFSEVDRKGRQIGSSREFTLRGDRFFVDNWIVSFDDKYVESGDPLRSCSLCVFKSIWGDIDGPNGGFSLDQQSENAPGIYQLAGQNEFEQQIWSDFWNVCHDDDKQQELGIRAMYGQAIYMQAIPGKSYQVQLRASGSAGLKTLPDSKSDESTE